MSIIFFRIYEKNFGWHYMKGLGNVNMSYVRWINDMKFWFQKYFYDLKLILFSTLIMYESLFNVRMRET